MRISQFFPLISVFLSFSLPACKDKEPETSEDAAYQLQYAADDNDSRINNIFDYAAEGKFVINFDSCSSIIVLQTNLCNSCNEEKLKNIFDSLNNMQGLNYFILAEKNEKIETKIKRMSSGAKIFIDSPGLLEKHNLSFIRNLKIYTCKKSIVRWSFL